jgi:hypothetical protein
MMPGLPIADHGALITAIPFVAPALAIVAGLVALVIRDRLSDRDRRTG